MRRNSRRLRRLGEVLSRLDELGDDEENREEVQRPSAMEVEEALLGGRRRYTRREAAEQAGVSFEFAQKLWKALGFASLPNDTVAFTDADVAALRKTKELLDTGLLDEQLWVRVARSIGHSTARLAESQVGMVTTRLGEEAEPTSDEAVRLAVDAAEQLIPEFEPLIIHAWRRQLAASGTRALAAANADVSPTRALLAVGFADLEAFTQLTRELDEEALLEVVEGFEDAAHDVVAALGGRIVKTLGDEVLFVTESPRVAAEIGLRLAEAIGNDGDVPDVRVGITYGNVALRLGDVFGTTVNLASRLTSLARPGTVLTDVGIADELEDARQFHLVRLRRRPVRGLGLVQPFVLRRYRAGGHSRETSSRQRFEAPDGGSGATG